MEPKSSIDLFANECENMDLYSRKCGIFESYLCVVRETGRGSDTISDCRLLNTTHLLHTVHVGLNIQIKTAVSIINLHIFVCLQAQKWQQYNIYFQHIIDHFSTIKTNTRICCDIVFASVIG